MPPTPHLTPTRCTAYSLVRPIVGFRYRSLCSEDRNIEQYLSGAEGSTLTLRQPGINIREGFVDKVISVPPNSRVEIQPAAGKNYNFIITITPHTEPNEDPTDE
jgi:hypothetical protein